MDQPILYGVNFINIYNNESSQAFDSSYDIPNCHRYNKVGLDVVSLSGWFVVCVIVSVDNERNIEVS